METKHNSQDNNRRMIQEAIRKSHWGAVSSVSRWLRAAWAVWELPA